jgi:DNA-binding response OmpR family regulator
MVTVCKTTGEWKMGWRTILLQPHWGGPPLCIKCDDEQCLIEGDTGAKRLSATEYRIMRTLLTHFEIACPYEELAAVPEGCACGPEFTGAVVRSTERLRDKIAEHPVSLRAVVGYGYALVPDNLRWPLS